MKYTWTVVGTETCRIDAIGEDGSRHVRGFIYFEDGNWHASFKAPATPAVYAKAKSPEFAFWNVLHEACFVPAT